MAIKKRMTISCIDCGISIQYAYQTGTYQCGDCQDKLIRFVRSKVEVTVLKDLNNRFLNSDLDQIRKLHNQGRNLREISQFVKRDEYEVLLALLHFHRERELTRPFGGVA